MYMYHVISSFDKKKEFFFRTLLEEYCSARKTLGAEESEIGNLNENVKDLIQALEKR